MSAIAREDVKKYTYEVKDILSGALVSKGLVYPFERDHLANINDDNTYIFRPPVSLRPGLIVLIKE